MNKFWENFQKGFLSTAPNAFQSYLEGKRYNEALQEKQRQQRAAERDQRLKRNADFDIAAKILSGKKTSVLPLPFMPRMMTTDLQPNDIFGLLKKANDVPFVNSLVKSLTPEQNPTVKVNNQLYQEDPNYKGKPIGEPLFTFPPEPVTTTKEEVMNASMMPGSEFLPNKGKNMFVTKTTQTKGDQIISELYSEPKNLYEEKSFLGKTYKDVSKEYSKQVSDYFQNQQKLLAQWNALQSGQSLVDKEGIPMTKADVEAQLKTINAEYLNYIDQNMSIEAQNFIDQSMGQLGTNYKDKNYQYSYYRNLLDAFATNQISAATYNQLINRMRAVYGYDPETLYNGQ